MELGSGPHYARTELGLHEADVGGLPLQIYFNRFDNALVHALVAMALLKPGRIMIGYGEVWFRTGWLQPPQCTKKRTFARLVFSDETGDLVIYLHFAGIEDVSKHPNSHSLKLH